MTYSTQFNVWNPCDAVLSNVWMAEKAIQPGDFLVVNVIETDRLIDRFTSQNRENGKNKGFRRNPETVPCDGDYKKNQNNRTHEANFFHHDCTR